MTVDDETIQTLRQLHTELKLDEEVNTEELGNLTTILRLPTTWTPRIGLELSRGRQLLTFLICTRGSWCSKTDLPRDFGSPRRPRRESLGPRVTASLETR